MTGQEVPRKRTRLRKTTKPYTPSASKGQHGRQKEFEDEGRKSEEEAAAGLSSSQSDTSQSLFGKILSYTPFRSKMEEASPVYTSSSSVRRRAEAEVKLEEKMIAAENEVSELEQDLELSEMKLISSPDETANKTAKLDSNHPLHEPNNIVNLKREIAELNDQLSLESAQHNLLKVQTKRKVQRLENDVKVFKPQHQATIAQIDEADEQYLGSDEDV